MILSYAKLFEQNPSSMMQLDTKIMNRINPDKLLLSKWTAAIPKQRERHFIVSKLIRGHNESIIACEIEAVISKNIYQIQWQELKDSNCWIMGWQ